MGNTVTNAAISQLGKPYVWDTPTDPNNPDPPSFDCSGLTMWCYKRAGITIAHQAAVQITQLGHRALSDAQPGDLVFFADVTNIPYHVAVYMGRGQIIEAPETGIPVRYRAITAATQDIMPIVGVYTGPQESAVVSGVELADDATGSGSTTATDTGLISSIGAPISAISGVVSWLTTTSNWRRIGLAVLAIFVLVLVIPQLFKGST